MIGVVNLYQARWINLHPLKMLAPWPTLITTSEECQMTWLANSCSRQVLSPMCNQRSRAKTRFFITPYSWKATTSHQRQDLLGQSHHVVGYTMADREKCRMCDQRPKLWYLCSVYKTGARTSRVGRPQSTTSQYAKLCHAYSCRNARS